ncbi:glycoside hydrolase family 88 protein [Parabacteroides sp. 52]|uniref:glycoside hydrolase family 88/105 protein n=1 Tax=unclassified Parabacteroides TaxID=2649774 RepID=UPI0013D8A86E|nr:MULTISPECIES: glycoside hydrolase family 88 protein [unclassified Parabacteroides]MDH6533631.1 unsaturated rhamnogalacturonyl hydrolase [Parabacteroides sp. PM5-20]NDV54383.1 glycoside hydrolase family 88 protein [Parabacteroides sp. 52]
MKRKKTKKILLSGVLTCFIALPAFPSEAPSSPLLTEKQQQKTQFTQQEILDISRKVADWQIQTFPENKYAKSEPKGWITGALYMGLFDWAELSGDPQYFDWLKKVCNRLHWQVADRMYHADDICVSQTYIDMFHKFGEEKMIIPTLARINWVIENPSQGSLNIDYSKASTYERWSWCDALYMAPGVYSRLYSMTGDKKYMEFADKEFKATYFHLFDKDENLFYRDSRYFGQQEANGKKVFWGRGNGWVIGGLTEMLKTLPAMDTTYRPFYENLFIQLASRLAELQNADGFWHASLLDPASYPSPETSATGFIVYGLAYGINQGYLPADKYLPVVVKGWEALVSAVEEDGKLGWVQPVGADPRKVTREMTELYGVGAFLMAACEVYQLNEK